jgi:hypothetical protein
MHSEYLLYAHHYNLNESDMDIKRISPGGIVTGLLDLSFRSDRPPTEWFYPPESSQPIVTEDIDYEIVEPSKLPPSNTTNEPER